MIGSDLERRPGGELGRQRTSDDAAAVRAVMRLWRAGGGDAVGVVSPYAGNAAVMQPKLETVVGSQQLAAT